LSKYKPFSDLAYALGVRRSEEKYGKKAVGQWLQVHCGRKG
jgi:hypothetical protein